MLQMCTAALRCSPQECPFLRGCFVLQPRREKCSTWEEGSKSCTSPARPLSLLGRRGSVCCPAASPHWCGRFFPSNAFSQPPQVAFRLDFEFSKSVFLQSMEIYLVANRLMLAAPPRCLQHRSPSACSSLLGGEVGGWGGTLWCFAQCCVCCIQMGRTRMETPLLWVPLLSAHRAAVCVQPSTKRLAVMASG